MNIRAEVLRVLGNTKHSVLDVGAAPGRARLLQTPHALEIHETDGGVFLLYLSVEGDCIADTWHASAGDAKEQAKFEFDIDEGDWVDVG